MDAMDSLPLAPLEFHEATTLPLETSQVIADCFFSDALSSTRPSTHLERVQEALHLYVNAKYVEHVPFKTLEPKLVELGVGSRSVNGAWGVVRDALRGM